MFPFWTNYGYDGDDKRFVDRYVDDLTFTLTDLGNGGCQVEGFSTSRLWFVNHDQ